MPVIPVGAFLAGALLSLLLPVTLLTVLSVWYWYFSIKVPAASRKRQSAADPAAANPGPQINQALPPEPEA